MKKRHEGIRLLPAALLIMSLLWAPARADEPEQTPNPGVILASFFKTYISPVDGDRCPSIPTCSSYSLAAFKRHGFFLGWWMTVDRLIHEGLDEAAVSPVVLINGKPHFFDPVENNDFWWYRPASGQNR